MELQYYSFWTSFSTAIGVIAVKRFTAYSRFRNTGVTLCKLHLFFLTCMWHFCYTKKNNSAENERKKYMTVKLLKPRSWISNKSPSYLYFQPRFCKTWCWNNIQLRSINCSHLVSLSVFSLSWLHCALVLPLTQGSHRSVVHPPSFQI